MAHPEVPSAEDVDAIFAQVERHFALRWLLIELRVQGPPGDPEEEVLAAKESDEAPGEASWLPPETAAGAQVTVLACHAQGSAREADGLVPVRSCQPLSFQQVADGQGRAKLWFLPAEVNKVQVSESPAFHGTEVMLPASQIRGPGAGPTTLVLELKAKALAQLTVHVFRCPASLPAGGDLPEDVDWAVEERPAAAHAWATLTAFDGSPARELKSTGHEGIFEVSGLPEGCYSLVVGADGLVTQERPLMLLVGANEFYVPLQAVS